MSYGTCEEIKISTHDKNSFYTAHHILGKYANQISKYILSFPKDERPVFIDFSAGDDYLGKKLRENDITVFSYDLVPQSDTIIKKDWFETDPYKYADDEKPCVIGFNPPFGPKGKFARHFLIYAMHYKPLRMYCLMPKSVKRDRYLNYKVISTDLLDARNSLITRDGKNAGFKPGNYVRVYEREEGYYKGPHRIYYWPAGIDTFYKVKTWYMPNTLFIRRSGWHPGQQLLYCDGKKHLILLRPNGDWVDRPTIKEINNAIDAYQAFQLTSLGEWKKDIESCMEKILATVISFNINRNEYATPSLKKMHFVKLLNEVVNTKVPRQNRKRKRLLM